VTQNQKDIYEKFHIPVTELLIVMALTAIQCLAQSTYEPYTFTTFAGGGGFNSPDVPGTAVRFWSPIDVAVDSADNAHVADVFNHAMFRLRARKHGRTYPFPRAKNNLKTDFGF
jgi:hypothetical protein